MATRPHLVNVSGTENGGAEANHGTAAARNSPLQLNRIEEIIEDIRLGKMVVLMDDEDRENEGDLVMAAECVTRNHCCSAIAFNTWAAGGVLPKKLRITSVPALRKLVM